MSIFLKSVKFLLADWTSFLGHRNYKKNFHFCAWPLSSCFVTGLMKITDTCKFQQVESAVEYRTFPLHLFLLGTLMNDSNYTLQQAFSTSVYVRIT